MKKIIFLLLASQFFLQLLVAQVNQPISLQFFAARKNDTLATISVRATIEKGVQLFTVTKQNTDDPFISQMVFDSSGEYSLNNNENVTESDNKKNVSDAAGINYAVFEDSAIFTYSLNVPGDSLRVKGSFSWLAKKGDEFPNGTQEFSIKIPSRIIQTSINTDASSDGEKSLWIIFIAGLIAGLGALTSPCIYAMLPVTVSFFTKRSKTRKEGIKNAIYYSLSIVGIFTLLGFLVTLIFGPGALNALSSSAVFNIAVFLMFLIFGISFLGAFEISLPSSWSTKLDSKAGISSFSGIFFMALTLVVVSFSCTVPFIGGLTVFIAKGGTLAPLIGFFGFSLALALPFALFALFPGMLNNIAKSGGWLNTIKVALGFIEIALAFKFLSSADLAYHWRILDREVYLSLWIVLFGLLGLYLLGKLKFSHDDDLPTNDYGKPYLSVTRLFFAITALSFTIYMIPGLWGAPLNGISAWLPEMKTQDFNLNKQLPVANTNNNNIAPKKYTDILESEIPGVTAFFDYEEGMAAAKQMNKPVMIDFTGHACANCRKMEREVLSNEEVIKILQQDFIVISLYVDDKYELPESEWKKSSNGNEITTMGEKNLEFEAALTNSNSQPQYVFVNPSGKILENAGGYNRDVQRFIDMLIRVKAKL